jgi:Ca2+:H+ antiporter
VAATSVVLGIPLVLGLDEPKDIVMLALTFVVMQGAVHLAMFAAFLFLALVP